MTRSSAATGHDETVVATEDAVPPREPTPVPSQSIFMQVVDFLLEVKAMPVCSSQMIVSCVGLNVLYVLTFNYNDFYQIIH